MRLQNVVLLKSGKNLNKNIFLVHAGNGEIANYIRLSSLMPNDVNCWGIRLAYKEYSPFNFTIERLAEIYLRQIKTIQPRGPYFLIGWCYGGMRTYEIARQLEEAGDEVKLLGLINTNSPIKTKEKKVNMVEKYSLLKSYDDHIEKFSCDSEKELIEKWLTKASLKWDRECSLEDIWINFIEEYENTNLEQKIISIISEDLPKDRIDAIPYFSDIKLRKLIYYLSILRSDSNMQVLYKPTCLHSTKLCYFVAEESPISDKNNWSQYASKVEFINIMGNHFSIFEENNVNDLAQKIRKYMEE